MSDWRGESSEKKPRDKRQKMPLIPRGEGESKPSREWRSGSANRVPTPPNAEGGRSWLGKEAPDAQDATGSLKKGLFLFLLGSLLIASIGGVVYWILNRPTQLPLLASVGIEQDRAPDFGLVPYAGQTLQLLEGLDVDDQNVARMVPKDPELVLKGVEHAIGQDSGWVDEGFRNDAKGIDGFVRLPRGKLVGGGGSGDVVVYYFSSFLVRRPTDGEWTLLTREDDPLEGQGVSLRGLLEQIADATPAGQTAMVGLDLHLPTAVTDLGNLSFPTQALEQAYESMAGSSDRRGDRGRVVLVLPCSEGQESWGAPELSSTAFGFFFQQGIFSCFGDRGLHLLSFEQELKRRVQDWVLQNRNAIQEPVILMDPTTRARADKIRFLWWSGAVPASEPNRRLEDYKRDELRARYQTLDRLWERCQKLCERNLWRWTPQRRFPMRFAECESRLLLLEEIAESTLGEGEESVVAPGQRWSKRVQDVEALLSGLETDWNSTRRVSLVESEIENQIGRNQYFDSNAGQDRDGQALRMWKEILETASGPASRWPLAFHEKTIAALERLGPLSTASDGTADEWLELQLVRILHRDVDWSQLQEREAAIPAIGRILRLFGELQRLASWPNSEMSVWIGDEVSDCERGLLQAVDLALTRQWARCLTICDPLGNRVVALQQQAKRVEDAMLGRDRALHAIPHCLAALMRLARYGMDGVSQQDIAAMAQELGRAAREGKEWELALSQPEHRLERGSDLAERLDRLEDQLNRWMGRWVEGDRGIGNPEAIRDMRAAVRFPFLSGETRQRYHAQLIVGYADPKNSQSIATSQDTHRQGVATVSPAQVQKWFWDELDVTTQDAYRPLLEGDARQQLLPITVTEVPANYAALVRDAFAPRTLANALGLRTLAKPDWSRRPPFTFPERWLEALDARQRSLQQQRLYQARWGSDEEWDQRMSEADAPYFQRLARQYLFAVDPTSASMPFLAADVNRDRDRALEAISGLSSMRGVQEEGETRAIRVQGVEKREVWSNEVASLRSGADTRLDMHAWNLSEFGPRLVPFETLPANELLLSFRGHRRRVPVASNALLERFATRWQAPREPPSLTVKAAMESQSIVVLLDCSNSMTGRFEDARSAVGQLLRTLRRQPGVASRVALVLFGVSVAERDLRGSPYHGAKARNTPLLHSLERDGKIQESRYYVVATEFKSMKVEKEYSELLKALEESWVRPTYGTPLYDAIYAACEVLGADGDANRTSDSPGGAAMVVVSDGTNDSSEPRRRGAGPDGKSILEYRGLGIHYSNENVESLLDPLLRSNADFYFYQVAVETKNASESQKENDARERAAFLALLKQYPRTRGDAAKGYQNFGQVLQEMTRVFALPDIQIEYLDDAEQNRFQRAAFDEAVPLRPGRVRLSAMRTSEGGKTELESEQPYELQVTGNEAFMLRYRDGRFVQDPPRDRDREPLLSIGKTSPVMGNTAIDVLAKTFFPAAGPSLELRWRPRSDRGDAPFLPRPPFVVATLRPQNAGAVRASDDNGEVVTVADLGFTPFQYPTLAFPSLRIGEPLRPTVQSQPFRLDVWWSFDGVESLAAEGILPWTVEKDSVWDAATMDPRLASAGIQDLRFEGTRITVRRQVSADAPVWFVLCPEAVGSERRSLRPQEGTNRLYQDRFDLDSETSKVRLYFCSDESLQRLASPPGEPVAKSPLVFHHRGTDLPLAQ